MRQRRHARRIAALLLSATALVTLSATAGGSTHAKAFPAGCWIGKTPFSGTYATGPVKAKVARAERPSGSSTSPGSAPEAFGSPAPSSRSR
jgi:hypothetical protein